MRTNATHARHTGQLHSALAANSARLDFAGQSEETSDSDHDCQSTGQAATARPGRTTAALLLIALCAAVFCSCHRKPMISNDTSDSVRIEYRDRYREKLLRDTTYVRDSIFIRERGDTVVIYRDRYQYVDRFVKDTVRVTDTIYQTIYQDRTVVEVRRHVPSVYRWSLLAALAALAWLGVSLWRRIKKT